MRTRLGQRLTPVAWTPDGTVYLTEETVIGGGRIAFPVPATAWSLNPTTGVLSELSATCVTSRTCSLTALFSACRGAR